MVEGELGLNAIEGRDFAIGFVFWAFKDQVRAKIFADIDLNYADDEAALSEAQRQTQGAQIAEDALVIERQIAALVWAAQANGENVEHAVDASPLALLGVEHVAQAVEQRPPGVGRPQHWFNG